MTTLDAIIDRTWDALRGNYFRRAILGKRRCAELVMHALAAFPDREFAALKVKRASDLERQIIGDIERRVVSRYRDTNHPEDVYRRVSSAVVMRWASAAVLDNLVTQWRGGKFDPTSIRTEYGWK